MQEPIPIEKVTSFNSLSIHGTAMNQSLEHMHVPWFLLEEATDIVSRRDFK